MLRARVVEGAAWLGLTLNEAANRTGGSLISATQSAVQVRVLRTNEEGVIAKHTARLVGTWP